jgi:pimeloyl-ACP methyl ester carboxylesterase
MVSGWTRRVLWAVSLGAALAFNMAAARAESIEGLYRIEGNGPDSDQAYKGEAQVKKTGDTYTIVWRIGESGHVGTGILTADVLSIFFQPLDKRGAPGVASFRIIDGKIADGTWTVLGGKVVGTERWTPDRGL